MRIAAVLAIIAAFTLSSAAQVKVAPMNIKERTLKNGLRVVSLQDNSSPTVAIHVWYNVGSKDDPEGRSGFAHMF
jgi:zinc protease